MKSQLTLKILLKNLFYFIMLVIIIWAIYAFTTGVLFFIKHKKVSSEYIAKSCAINYYSNETGPDRVVLIDDPLESGLARLGIIRDAQNTLNIAYFSIDTSESAELFFAALLDAANRDVQVNLLLDGVFHGINRELKPIFYALISHPNIDIKLYEPPSPLTPWTINNRMHDKYIIADNGIGMIGGRNIGDKYFNPDWYTKSVTNDRDVIIINTESYESTSVINEMTNYFDEIWSHKYTKDLNIKINKSRREKGMERQMELADKLAKAKETYKDKMLQYSQMLDISVPTNKITFIHNPLTRFSKEPWCLYEITKLMKAAKSSIFIQSPYVVPSKAMTKGYLNDIDAENIDIFILTNSLASTPNFPAFSGYTNHRKKLVDKGITIFEYQSKDSIHAKAFTIDNDLLAIGTFNADPRSAFLSTESMVVIHSAEAAEKLDEGLMQYIEESLVVDKDYNYIESNNVEEVPVNIVKRVIVFILSHIVRFFEFLL